MLLSNELPLKLEAKLKQRQIRDISITTYVNVCKDYVDFLDYYKKEPSELTASEFLEKKQGKGIDPKTLNKIFFIMKVVLGVYFDKQSKEVHIPFKLPKLRFREPKFFTWDTIKYILDTSEPNKRDYIFIRAMVATLARKNEVLQLEKKDLYMEKYVTVDNEGNEIERTAYMVNFREEISKSESRKIVIDKLTWNQMNAMTLEEGRLFKFTTRMATYILDKYKPRDIEGNLHAIRHGMSRYIAPMEKLPYDRDIRAYYMGHKTNVRDLYALASVKELSRWFFSYHPLMKIGRVNI